MFFRADAAAPAPATRAPRTAIVVTGVAVASLALFGWRYAVLHAHGEPVGVDIGNWLALGRAVGGRHVSGSDAVYPPVVPLLVRLGSSILDVAALSHVTAAAAALAPGVGLWAATRGSLGRGWAAAAAVAVTVAGTTSAAAAWGGLPQLLGLGLAPVLVVAAARFPDRGGRVRALELGGWAALLAAVSPLVFGLGGMAALLALAFAAMVRHSLAWLRAIAWAALPLVLVTPLYVRFLAHASLGRATGFGGSGHAGSLDAVFVGGAGWWALLGAIALAAPALTWFRRVEPLWSASAAMTVVAAGALVVGAAPRYACLAPTAAAAGAAVACAWGRHVARRIAILGGAAALVGILVTAPATMSHQRDVYAGFVPGGTTDAISWLRHHTDARSTVAVAPVAGVPFGWLVEGWAQRPSLVGSDPTWLVFPGERARAALATRIFTARHWPSETAFARARRAGARWLYVPTGWDGVDRGALRRAEIRHPGLVRYRGRGALILAVPAEDAPR